MNGNKKKRGREKVKISCRRNIPESRHGSKAKHYRSKATGYTELVGAGVRKPSKLKQSA